MADTNFLKMDFCEQPLWVQVCNKISHPDIWAKKGHLEDNLLHCRFFFIAHYFYFLTKLFLTWKLYSFPHSRDWKKEWWHKKSYSQKNIPLRGRGVITYLSIFCNVKRAGLGVLDWKFSQNYVFYNVLGKTHIKKSGRTSKGLPK